MLNRLFIAIAIAATAQHAVAFIGLPPHAAPAPDGDVQVRSTARPSSAVVPPKLMRRLVPEGKPDEPEMRQDGIRADNQRSCWMTKCQHDRDCEKVLLKDPQAAEAALAGSSSSDSDNEKHKDEGEGYFIDLHALGLVRELKDDDFVPCSEKCQDMGGDVGKLCLDAGDAWNVRVGEKLGNGRQAGSGR
ncbi:hypothetical protein F5X96DRAFT_685178 [Biscogniauxia mediterranea]|nr:hypothetical protein F5X96DRAFT_685178 [Biscogniauxia mediterranea]